jgi:hypothetical protein
VRAADPNRTRFVRLASASVIFPWNNLMQRAEFMHLTTLRRTFLVAGIVAAFIGALLGFVYLKAKADLTIRSDRIIASQIGVLAELSPERRLDAINQHLKQVPAVFSSQDGLTRTAAGSRATWKVRHPTLGPIMRYKAPWSTGRTKGVGRNRRSA